MRDDRKTLNSGQLKSDIVVMGGGGSGLAAAVAAAEMGAKVIVVEKRKAPGGNSALASGICATESQMQRDMRLFVSTDRAFKMVMEYSRLEVDPRIVRAFLDKSADTVQWLEEKGVKFDSTALLYDDHDLPVWHCPIGGRGGADIVRTLLKKGSDLGIKVFRETPGAQILKDERGRVTGILARAKEKELRINAKSVIIATGGHGSNKELLKKYHSSYTEALLYLGTPLNGDGVLIANEAGANTEGWGTLLYHSPLFPMSILSSTGTMLRAVLRQPLMIWVNKRGERFVDEGYPYVPVDTANALDRQPGKMCYALFDETTKQSIIREGFKRGVGYFLRPAAKPADLDKQLQLQLKNGLVALADSWGGIARWIGVAPGVLKSTVQEYNRFCDQGYDKDFLKERRHLLPLRKPPYYGIKCVSTYLDTIGGIKINHRMEVLDHNDRSIPGLYAVGVTTSGWAPKSYCMMLSGNAFGFAVNSGRIAGENAAEYIKGKR